MSSIARLRATYITADFVMSVVGAVVFALLRYRIMSASGTSEVQLFEWLKYTPVWSGILLFPVLNIAICAVTGYYNDVFSKSRLDDLRNSFGSGLLTTLGVFFVALINDPLSLRAEYYELLIYLWLCMSVPVATARLIITNHRRLHLREGAAARRTIIVGTPSEADRMIAKLRPRTRKEIAWYDIVGTVAPHVSEDDVRQLIADKGVECVVITHLPGGMEAARALIQRIFSTGIDIYVSPDMYYLITSRTRIASVTAEPLVKITGASISPAAANIKRLTDIAFSAVALVALLPVYAAIAVAVKCSSSGPIFYTQERVGYHRRPFRIIKFRTMSTDAEANGPALSSPDDSRVTSVGRFLRKYRLDELPQFWNVLVGEMSIVGPRPERQYYLDLIAQRVPHCTLIHSVRPGITSLGMVRYGYASNIDEMIERLAYDLIYIENVSLVIDLKILLNTVATVIGGRGM